MNGGTPGLAWVDRQMRYFWAYLGDEKDEIIEVFPVNGNPVESASVEADKVVRWPEFRKEVADVEAQEIQHQRAVGRP